LKKYLTIFFLFITTIVFAQEGIIHELKDFSKLLQSHVNEYLIPDGAGKQAQNLQPNDVYGSLSKRVSLLTYGDCRSAAVKGLHRYYKSDATKYLLVASSTYLDKGDDDGGACTTLDSELTDGKRWTFVTYKDIAIGMNGYDNPIKYDGHTQVTADTDGSRSSGLLVADLGAPFAELNTGANLDASSWYQYKVAFYDGTTYSYSDARSNPIQTGASVQDIALTDVPLGASGTTARYIYRTVGDASQADVEADTSFYLVDTISDNSTRTYSDSDTDAAILADDAPTWATVSAGNEVSPPKGKFCEIHKERLWIGNDPSSTTSYGKSIVYWSDTLNPDYFTATDYELIRPDDGDDVQFLKNQLGILVIGKTNTIQKFYTEASSSSNWVLSNPFSFIGTPAPYTVSNSPLGIMYLGRDGIYVFNGENSKLISDKVTDKIRDILTANIDEAAGTYHNNTYQLAYTAESTGAGENDRVLVLDLVRDSYVLDTKNINTFEVFDSGDDYGTLYSGSSTTNGKIYAHETSPSNLIQRYKSELEEGTVDSVIITGTETDPAMEIGWGITIDSVTMAGITMDSATYSSATIDRPGLTGIWYSPAIQVEANALEKLYWNEVLGVYGDVSFSIATASTEAGITDEAFNGSFTDSSGADISSITANDWIKLRATLTTSDVDYSPELILNDNFVIKLTYSQEGSDAETSIATIFETGWMRFGVAGYSPIRIREILVHYQGTDGDVNFNVTNNQGDIDDTFTIDLSVNADDSTDDDYYGTETDKIYRYIPSVEDDQLVGRFFKYLITETGTTNWKITKIVTRLDGEEYVTYP